MKPHPLAILVLLLTAGCVGVSEKTYPISGGQTITLPIAPGGAIPTENADIKIEMAGFGTDAKARQLTYGFALLVKNGKALSAVTVEDVSDAEPVLMVHDAHPQLHKAGWMGRSSPRTLSDPNLHWLLEDADSVRIYRFTITLSDGTRYVMYQGSLYRRDFKPMVRHSLGG